MITDLLAKQLKIETDRIVSHLVSFLDTFDSAADGLVDISFTESGVTWYSIYEFDDGEAGEEFFTITYQRYNQWCNMQEKR